MPGELYEALKSKRSWWRWWFLLFTTGLVGALISHALSLAAAVQNFPAGFLHSAWIDWVYAIPVLGILFVWIFALIFKYPARITEMWVLVIAGAYFFLHGLVSIWAIIDFVRHCRSGAANYCWDGVARYANYNWLFGSHIAAWILCMGACLGIWFYHASSIENKRIKTSADALEAPSRNTRVAYTSVSGGMGSRLMDVPLGNF